MAEAGLSIVHVSIHSVRPEVEERLRGVAGTLERAHAAIDNAHAFGVEVNVNCVINALNADHLDENVRELVRLHPHVKHFVWNNLDPSMGRAEVNQEQFTPRLADFELSLHRALRFLDKSGRTFRVERVPLCYMTEFAWASTETRKIVKGEERVVHFLDAKQTVRQTDWGAHLRGRLRHVLAALDLRRPLRSRRRLRPGRARAGVRVHDAHRGAHHLDPADPSYPLRTYAAWRGDFDRRLAEARAQPHPRPAAHEDDMPPPRCAT
ncbi:MAG: hypothetical protein M5U28_04355 [Sandaracinaceae bacterium]|nr:hypothetical protein [Sandaracinaceae bacterium]